MGETRVGLIPYATTIMRTGQLETCAILVSDRRTILAFDSRRPLGPRAAFKEFFRKEPDPASEAPQPVDFRTVDLDVLAVMNDNISVQHSAIEKLEYKKGLSGYSLFIESRNLEGKKEIVLATIAAPSDLVKKQKSEGVPAKEAKRQYALKAQELFKRAMPSVVAHKARWVE